MSEYYTRKEICKMFNPPVSKHYLRTLESKRRMPSPVKRTANGYVYDKKQIDEWFSNREEKKTMSNKDFDVWNLRKKKEPIKYNDEMTLVIMFLQPGLKNRLLGNEI
jgi:hypothetical protein